MVAFWVRIKLGSPVFFRQKRPGKGAQIFEMIKFRTMTDARDASGALLPDGERLTSLGRWLRSSSLDELPALEAIVICLPTPLDEHREPDLGAVLGAVAILALLRLVSGGRR